MLISTKIIISGISILLSVAGFLPGLANEAQDSLKAALVLASEQASSDSSVAAKPASAPEGIVDKEKSGSLRSIFDRFTLQIDPAALITGLVGLVLIVYLARKRREAELRAEDEHRKRTELENRQREVENRLALLEAEHDFTAKVEKRDKTQKAKTAEERYRQILKDEVCRIHLAVPGLESVAVSLVDTFVHLNISEQYHGELFPRLGESGRYDGEHEDLSPNDVMARSFNRKDGKSKALLVVGDPGSGKTTLLKYYADCCLQADGHRRLGFAKPVFPFYLPLREVDPGKGLGENLWRWAKIYDSKIPLDQFDGWLSERDSLVLLDGLDEVAKLDDRKKVCAWIDKKATGLHRANFVITSRGTALRSEDNLPLPPSLSRAEVRDFSPAQKREFLRKWFPAAYLASGKPLQNENEAAWRARQLREAANDAEEVIAYLEQPANRSLRELAGIPMLLQLIALIRKQYKTKPDSRTKLYDVALDYLLEYRDDQRGLAPLLKADKARRLLAPAALWMQEKLQTEEVAKDQLHDYVRPLLEPIDNKLAAEEFFANLRDRAGIIADYGKNGYIFRHKSFREYFAGMHLVNNYKQNNRVARLVKTFGDETWAEPLRYFISKADSKAFTGFMKALLISPISRDFSQSQQDLLQTVMREAAEKPIEPLTACLRSARTNANQQRYALDCLKTIGGEPVREFLESYARSGAGKQSIVAYAREISAQLSAPAVSLTSKAIKAKLFAELPVSFRNPLEYNAEYIFIRGGTINYSATKKVEKVPDLYFAKYPVTNKQYRRFIRYLQGEEADLVKIASPKRFSEKLLEFASSDKAYADYIGGNPKTWPDKLKSEYDEGRKFNGDEQPVVGVSWYAAQAYCFWLSLLDAGMRDPSLRTSAQQLARTFRLPSEIEWERAAAGRIEDGPPRKYPWPAEKGEPNKKLANYYDGKAGQTTPVGRYPEGATPEGLMDMAGNVWEWQENWYDEKEKAHRALRGGSWLLIADYLQCAVRDGNVPGVRYDDIGFRVVRAQSFFDTL
jgi:formylglycine-generating enzyme required for sulfatase activity/energy-coupling factor transporter ATP-binding protein EcfA2